MWSFIVQSALTHPTEQELTFNYRSNNLHRPDGALLGYGFVPDSLAPLLCSIDLPPGFNGAAQTDPAYGGGCGCHCWSADTAAGLQDPFCMARLHHSWQDVWYAPANHWLACTCRSG